MKTIEDVLTATTTAVLKECTKILLQYYPKKVFVCDEDFAYAVGESPIMLVSHVDTVRDKYDYTGGKVVKKEEKDGGVLLVKNRNVVSNANGVLGADDRAGVFACLEIVRRCAEKKLPLPSVLLTNGEESGGIGVGVFTGTKAFEKYDEGRTRIFVEMDRCNSNDWVTYGGPLPREVIDYVESFGFKRSSGSYSDISDLQDEYLIPGVNLSIGYYNQHSSSETLHLDEMYMTINRVMGMMADPIEKLYKVTPSPKGYGYGYGWGRDDEAEYEYYRTLQKNNANNTSTRPKKDESGKGSSASTTIVNKGTFPHDKTGSTSIDEKINKIAFGGWCKECGYEMEDCECGNILQLIINDFTEPEIELFITNYLSEGTTLEDLLRTYLSMQEEKRKLAEAGTEKTIIIDAEVTSADENPKDPFHVGKEGDPVPLLTETSGSK